MGKKELNPADAYRREMKKKEIKKNKIRRDQIREVHSMLNNPDKIEEEIEKVRKESNENKLDKGLKERLKELEMMKSVALKKKMAHDMMKGIYNKQDEGDEGHSVPTRPPGSSSSSSSFRPVGGTGSMSLGQGHQAGRGPPPGIGLTTGRRPEESVYFHPQFNPTGTPPPGQPMMYRPPPGAMAPGQRPLNAPPQHMAAAPLGAAYDYPAHLHTPGIPPPPPPQPLLPQALYGPPMHAPPTYMGIPYAPPRPPPRPAVVIGGTNGVPLPPPLPGQGQLFLAQPPAEPRLTNAQKRRAAAMAIKEEDPLDPAGAGYLDRYGSKVASRAPQHLPYAPGAAGHYGPSDAMAASSPSHPPPHSHSPSGMQLGTGNPPHVQATHYASSPAIPPVAAGPPPMPAQAPAASNISQQFCVDASEYDMQDSEGQVSRDTSFPASAAAGCEYEVDSQYYMDMVDNDEEEQEGNGESEEGSGGDFDGDEGRSYTDSDESAREAILSDKLVEGLTAGSIPESVHEEPSRLPYFVPPTISAEEIMRRRFLLKDDTAETLPAGPAMPDRGAPIAVDDGLGDAEGPMAGPSLPPTGPSGYHDLPEYYKEGGEGDDDAEPKVTISRMTVQSGFARSDTSSSVYLEDVSDDESAEDTHESIGPTRLPHFSAPVKPQYYPAPTVPIKAEASAPRALQSLFGDYGSGDEEDEDAVEEEVEPTVAPSVSGAGTGAYNLSSAPSAHLPTQHQQPATPVGYTLPGDRLGAPIPAPASISGLPLQGQGPKIVKVDTALTGFVPTALRKRSHADLTAGPPKRPKPTTPYPNVPAAPAVISPAATTSVGHLSLHPEGSSGPGTAASHSISQGAVGTVSVNDAYDEFMKEISGLL